MKQENYWTIVFGRERGHPLAIQPVTGYNPTTQAIAACVGQKRWMIGTLRQ